MSSIFPTPEARIAAFLHNNGMGYAKVHRISFEDDMLVCCITTRQNQADPKPWTVRLRDRPTYRNKGEVDPAPEIISREEGFVV